MQDVMVDLETLGNVPGCVILSIGARAFDPDLGLLGKGFYGVLSTASCEAAGLHRDKDTEAWWAKQSAAARTVITAAQAPEAVTLVDGLKEFSTWLKQFGGNVRVWGNGSDFDNAIMAVAYRLAGIPTPWKFWNSRCFRTLKNLFPDVQEVKRTGTYHNALDDATTQAEHALVIFGGFNGWAEGCEPVPEATAA